MLDWQFVPEPGVLDWRTGVRDRIDAYTPTAADAGSGLSGCGHGRSQQDRPCGPESGF